MKDGPRGEVCDQLSSQALYESRSYRGDTQADKLARCIRRIRTAPHATDRPVLAHQVQPATIIVAQPLEPHAFESSVNVSRTTGSRAPYPPHRFDVITLKRFAASIASTFSAGNRRSCSAQ